MTGGLYRYAGERGGDRYAGGGGGAGRQESYATGKALARDETKILL